MIKKLIIFLILIAASAGVVGQASFEIRAVPKGFGGIAVEMRSVTTILPGINDYVTDIVFGIKWNSSLNIDLSNSISTNYNLKKAGTRSSKNTRHFQAFYSDPVGFNPITPWPANGWVEVMAIGNLPGSGLASFEICEPGFDITTNPNFGLNFIDYTPAINGGAVNIPLPVAYVSFDVLVAKEYVHLLWNTGSEVNSKDFLVQRSLSGSNFETIGRIPAAGNSTTIRAYEYKDEEARKDLKGKNVYYRVAELSNNGLVQYTGTKKVFIPNLKNTLQLVYYAARKEAILSYDCQQSDKVEINIFDMTGRTVLKKSVPVAGGNNQITLPMYNLADGVYKVELIGKYDHQEASLLKQ